MTYVNSKGQEFDTLEEMMAEHERNMTVWEHVRRRYFWHVRNPIRDARKSVRWAYQRVTRGWDDLSVWSVRDSLSKTLGAQLVEMANISHGCPPYYPEQPGVGGPQLFLPTPGDEVHELWRGDLRRHGEALLAYSRDEAESPDISLDLYMAAQESLRWVADNLADLWD